MKIYRLATLIVAIMLVMPGMAEACSVCFGDPNSPMVQGMKYGILALLGCIGTLLFGFASLFLYWMRRSKQFHLNEGATN